MAGVSLSLSHGVEGFKISDFTVGTLVPGGGSIELRFTTTDLNNNVVTRQDVVLGCKAFIRALESGNLITSTPVL